MEQDHNMRVALKEVHLENALDSLRKAVAATDDDAERADLTAIAAGVAQRKRSATQYLADMRQAHARLAETLLES